MIGRLRVDDGGKRSLAADAAAQNVVGQESQHHGRGIAAGHDSFSDRAIKRQVRLAQQVAAQKHHQVGGGLNVDGPADHSHQLLPKRRQLGRNARVFLVAQRTRMQGRHIKAVETEELERVATDEGQVHVARARPVSIEGAPSFHRVPVTALPRRTAPTPTWDRVADRLAKFVKPAPRLRRRRDE